MYILKNLMHNYKVQIGAASEKNSNQDLHRNSLQDPHQV